MRYTFLAALLLLSVQSISQPLGRPSIHIPTQESANVEHEYLSLLIEDTIKWSNGQRILPISVKEYVWLPYLDKELEKYPDGLLEQFNVEIYVVGAITIPDEETDFFPENTGILGTYELTDSINYIYLVPSKGIRENLHHELNSVLVKVKIGQDKDFKELAEGYCGYFQSVSDYKEEGWQEPLENHEIYLGDDHYAQVDCENDMNVVASYLFIPLKGFNYNGLRYNLWDFMHDIYDKDLPIFSKVAQTAYLYEKIHPTFTTEYFQSLDTIHVEDIPLEYYFEVSHK